MIRLLKDEVKVPAINIMDASFALVGVMSPSFHYLTFRGDTEQEAREFLSQQGDIPPHTYYAVEVKNIAYCRDIKGYYQEEASFTHLK